MTWDVTSMMDRYVDSVDRLRSGGTERRYRRVPPAVTPLRATDIAAGIAGQVSGTGLEAFRNDVGTFLDATAVGTYTSFRRALGACLFELAEKMDEDRTEVFVPAFCSSDYPDAIEGAGLETVRYDVDPNTLALDTDSLETLPMENAAAVVVVNVLGYGSPMDRIETYCRENDTYLIEALGYALGAEYDGRPLGTFGDCSVLNFQQGKPIPVGGGMVVSRNGELNFDDERRSPVTPNIGVLSGYAAFGHPRLYYVYSEATEWIERYSATESRISTHPESKFGVPYEPPFKTLSDFQGAVAGRVFDRLETDRRQRESTAHMYATELADCRGVRHLRPVEGLSKHQHVRYPLLVEDIERRKELKSALSKAGIGTAMMYDWPPLDDGKFPGAARVQNEILTLPTHPYVDEDDRQRIVRIVRDVLSGSKR